MTPREAVADRRGRGAERSPDAWPPVGREAAPAAVSGPGPEALAARQLAWGAAALSFSVLADSAAEHYRAGFHNPAMFLAPAVAGLTLLASTAQAVRGQLPRHGALVLGAAVLTGAAGTGFHVWNVSRRVGGWRWENLFYGAPLAAPLGLAAAGLMGAAAAGLRRGALPGRLLAAGAALGLLGTAVEAGLLHFRGAFNHPAMYLPVTLPPAAALALAAAAGAPARPALRRARVLSALTVAMGIGGVGFHARGIARSMGGWRNWRQNLLAGPPLPAPPSFTGMALAGLAALSLLQAEAR